MEGALSLLFHRANTSAEAEKVKKKKLCEHNTKIQVQDRQDAGCCWPQAPGPRGVLVRAPWSRATRRRRLPALAASILAYIQC